MISLEETVIRKLKTTQQILCTVESCTGGLIGHLLTNVSGASEVYWGSFVTYDNSAKEELGVPRNLIEQKGAVSLEVATLLAESGLSKLQKALQLQGHSNLIKAKGLACIATTGIAGPSGGTREKPVGLCYIALAVSGKKTIVENFYVAQPQDRIQTKIQFAHRALELVRGSF